MSETLCLAIIIALSAAALTLAIERVRTEVYKMRMFIVAAHVKGERHG